MRQAVLFRLLPLAWAGQPLNHPIRHPALLSCGQLCAGASEEQRQELG